MIIKKKHFELLDSSLPKIFSSILWSFLKSISLSFEKLGQWRRQWIVVSIVPQLQIGFNVSWKLCLNLWNQRWRKLSLSLAITIKPSELWQWKVLFAAGLIKANIHYLKIAKLSEFLVLESMLFHPIIVEEQKIFLK